MGVWSIKGRTKCLISVFAKIPSCQNLSELSTVNSDWTLLQGEKLPVDVLTALFVSRSNIAGIPIGLKLPGLVVKLRNAH